MPPPRRWPRAKACSGRALHLRRSARRADLRECPGGRQDDLAETGSEADSLAIRIARAVTGRSHIIVMAGRYNGNHDELACNVFNTRRARSARACRPANIPCAIGAGTTITQTHFTHAVNYNDLESVRYVCRRYPVAALITEPLLQNIGGGQTAARVPGRSARSGRRVRLPLDLR
jgi:4-aminobutyrate aminotransferase-like enzyme